MYISSLSVIEFKLWSLTFIPSWTMQSHPLQLPCHRLSYLSSLALSHRIQIQSPYPFAPRNLPFRNTGRIRTSRMASSNGRSPREISPAARHQKYRSRSAPDEYGCSKLAARLRTAAGYLATGEVVGCGHCQQQRTKRELLCSRKSFPKDHIS